MMVRSERLILEFRQCRGPFPYRELVRLLVSLDYVETATAGGAVAAGSSIDRAGM